MTSVSYPHVDCQRGWMMKNVERAMIYGPKSLMHGRLCDPCCTDRRRRKLLRDDEGQPRSAQMWFPTAESSGDVDAMVVLEDFERPISQGFQVWDKKEMRDCTILKHSVCPQAGWLSCSSSAQRPGCRSWHRLTFNQYDVTSNAQLVQLIINWFLRVCYHMCYIV